MRKYKQPQSLIQKSPFLVVNEHVQSACSIQEIYQAIFKDDRCLPCRARLLRSSWQIVSDALAIWSDWQGSRWNRGSNGAAAIFKTPSPNCLRSLDCRILVQPSFWCSRRFRSGSLAVWGSWRLREVHLKLFSLSLSLCQIWDDFPCSTVSCIFVFILRHAVKEEMRDGLRWECLTSALKLKGWSKPALRRTRTWNVISYFLVEVRNRIWRVALGLFHY
jgi:hypothetical protein